VSPYGAVGDEGAEEAEECVACVVQALVQLEAGERNLLAGNESLADQLQRGHDGVAGQP
jgi:hypothetical protein